MQLCGVGLATTNCFDMLAEGVFVIAKDDQALVASRLAGGAHEAVRVRSHYPEKKMGGPLRAQCRRGASISHKIRSSIDTYM